MTASTLLFLLVFAGVSFAQTLEPSLPCREIEWPPSLPEPTLCEKLGQGISPSDPNFIEITGGLSSALNAISGNSGWYDKKILLSGNLTIDDMSWFYNCEVKVVNG